MNLKAEKVAAVVFGEPTPAAVVERDVPFIPNALRPAELQPSGDGKANAFMAAACSQRDPRTGGNEVSDFAEIFKALIRSADGIAAVIADDDAGAADFEFERGTAARTPGRLGIEGDIRHGIPSMAMPGRWQVRTSTREAPSALAR